MDPPPPRSGVRAALEYTGIPASWLSARPRLPSRNWCIFITLTSSLISYYAYDRHQARAIRQSYIDRVKHFASEPMKSTDFPRRVVVYGAKWPGDEDHQRAIRFFKKYVKPVLVAAAVDYDIIATRRSGDLAERVTSTVIKDRRLALGLDQSMSSLLALPNQPTREQKHARELEGGTILVGRHTFKEYMAGLKRGWSGGLDLIDKEEKLAQNLASDGTFDETDGFDSSPVGIVDDANAEPIPTRSRLPPSNNAQLFSPLKLPTSRHQIPTASNSLLVDSTPPATIPPQPPLLLVPSVNYVGFRFIPHMIWGFFNERHKTRIGCEAAYSLVISKTREFQGPSSLDPNHDIRFNQGQESSSDEGRRSEVTQSPSQPQGGDLDFGLSSEYVLVPHSPLSNIASSRKSYYETLPQRLATARQLARGEREPTKEEERTPPPSEVELRTERLNKELRWRGEEEAWKVVGPGSGVSWDERFREVLRVFDDSGVDGEELVINNF